MPKKSSFANHSLLAAAVTCLLPLLALAAQQAPPAPAPGAARTGGTGSGALAAAPGAGPARRPAGPQDARTSEIGLGLTSPENPKLPSLILIGDSTVRNGHGTGSDGLWGWGAPIFDLFDPDKINVVNRAIGGLSSHSYISQGHWDLALEIIKPGDYVLIQWGHNDGPVNVPGAKPIPDAGLAPGATPPAPPANAAPRPVMTGGSLPGIGEETYDAPDARTNTTVTIHTYGWYLRKYIADVKAKGATPVICSLVPRKIWQDGKIVRQTSTFRGWAQQVAEQQHVGFIDLNDIIARKYDALGEAAVDPLFGDPHTHTTMAGAVLSAEYVVAGLRALPGDPLAADLSDKGKLVKPYSGM